MRCLLICFWHPAFLMVKASTGTPLGLPCTSVENPALQTSGMSISQFPLITNQPQNQSRANSFLHHYKMSDNLICLQSGNCLFGLGKNFSLSLVFSLNGVLLSSPTLFFRYKFQQVRVMLKSEAHLYAPSATHCIGLYSLGDST